MRLLLAPPTCAPLRRPLDSALLPLSMVAILDVEVLIVAIDDGRVERVFKMKSADEEMLLW